MDKVEQIEESFDKLALLLRDIPNIEDDIELSKALDRRNHMVIQLSELLTSE